MSANAILINGNPIEKKPIIVDGRKAQPTTAEQILKARRFGAVEMHHDLTKNRDLKGWRRTAGDHFAKLGLVVREEVMLYPFPGATTDNLVEAAPYEIPIDDRTPLMGARYWLKTIVGACAETFPARPTDKEFSRLALRWIFQHGWSYWQHLTISHTSGSLTINTLHQIKHEFVGDNREAYQVLAASRHDKSGTAHLWHHLLGLRGVGPDGAVLPRLML